MAKLGNILTLTPDKQNFILNKGVLKAYIFVIHML